MLFSNRIIVVDVSVLIHKSIFSHGMSLRLKNQGKIKSDFILPVDYTYFNMLQSILKRIGIEKDDTIILAEDAFNSWRKAFYPSYKAQRKENRDAFKEINWNECFEKMEIINAKLNRYTDWQFLRVSKFMTFQDLEETKEGKELINHEGFMSDHTFGIECDDIAAVISKNFPNNEVILVTIDKDWDMLAFNKNTKIFSLTIKYKAGKGCYKIIDDPLKVLSSKIKRGDISDNIIVPENDTEHDVKVRKLIINLLDLPSWVEQPILECIHDLREKEMNYERLPFSNSLGKKERLDKIYLKDNMVTWEDGLKYHVKKQKKIEKKKEEAKEKRKKQKEEAFR